MKVFLIAGKAGSGKNEVAVKIKQLLPKTVITSISKYIKLFALEYTDLDGRDFNKPRRFLQTMGDKIRRVDEYFFINRIKEDLKIYSLDYDNVIISDIRLIKEIEEFKKDSNNEIITIKVISSKSKRNLTQEEQNHITETELDNYNKFDYIIENNEELDNKLKEILKGMK